MVARRSPRPSTRTPHTPESRRAAHVARCIRLHELLRGGGKTLYELAEELEISVKTVRRDLKTLEAAEHPVRPIDEREGANVWQLVNRSRGLHRVEFDALEAMAVYIALVRCRTIAATGLVDGLEGALKKIEGTLDHDERDAVRNLARKFYDRGEDAIAYSEKDRDNADAIVRALQYDERLTLTTTTVVKGTSTTRTHYVEPLTVGFYQNGVYLAARYVGRTDKVYRFALDKIDDATVHHDDRFEYPADWQPRSWFGRGFGIVAPRDDEKIVRVRIRFTGDGEYLRRVKRRVCPVEGGWEPSEDGSAVLWMLVGEKDFEVPNWIVRFAGNVEVLEPSSLRGELAHRGKQLLEINSDRAPGANPIQS